MEFHVTTDGWLTWAEADGRAIARRAALGRGGIGIKGGEGDGITPAGRWPLRRIHYRADCINFLSPHHVPRNINKNDGWCDDPGCADYNRRVALPHAGSVEHMWRDDGLYDVVVEVGYNDAPVIPGKGSAIFIHIARPDYAPTEGCVALALDDLQAMLAACDGDDWLVIS